MSSAMQAAAPRAFMPDYLRLFALFGIVVVNVQFMAFPIDQGFAAASQRGPVDDVVAWLVYGLATLKTYGLFSFMFGVGLAFQIRSAERRGQAFGLLYRNRMLGLCLLGLFHGVLVFPGDILLVYGIIGGVLFAIRNRPVRALVRLGAGLLAAQIVIAGVITAFVPVNDPEIAALERIVMREGAWADVLTFRAISYAVVATGLLFFQGVSALGWFCLGLAAVKSGLIDRPDHALWARARRWCLVPGMALSLIGAWAAVFHTALWGDVLVIAAAPLATLGYLGVIARIAKPPRGFGAALLQAGGASLTIYLGQSIVLSSLFSPYGGGLWDVVSAWQAVLLALVTTLVLVLALVAWRRVFVQGPFEWVLRKITYMGQR